MKAWIIESVGRERLQVAEIQQPEPGPGEVLIRVANVSLNYRDLLVLDGKMGDGRAFPFVPGSDLAGAVVSCGDGVTRFRCGDRVMSTYVPGWVEGRRLGSAAQPNGMTLGGPLPGVLAEFVALPEDWLVRSPDSLSDPEASTLPIAGVTAWFSLVQEGRLCAGQTVLVQGTGGVALFGVQVAKAHGAKVIVTSSDEGKLTQAKALGADFGIRRDSDWVKGVIDATDGHGADHILEIAGGPNLGKSVEAAAVGGQIAVIGIIEGLELAAPAFPLLLKQVVVRGIFVGHRRAAEDFAKAIDAIGLKPVIDRRYPLAALPDALAHLERGPFGKVVIDVSE
ncbi:MAG: zinc-dependent alcohol dehydrogenase family protein [Methylocystis sp.]|uniref:zinc-dependent alcohol dehydrogenase family protein n=1 Tax=Methylocystis sp. TaxID=1911079 RepID=UPI003DA41626